jgi:hypothetical protein
MDLVFLFQILLEAEVRAERDADDCDHSRPELRNTFAAPGQEGFAVFTRHHLSVLLQPQPNQTNLAYDRRIEIEPECST